MQEQFPVQGRLCKRYENNLPLNFTFVFISHDCIIQSIWRVGRGHGWSLALQSPSHIAWTSLFYSHTKPLFLVLPFFLFLTLCTALKWLVPEVKPLRRIELQYWSPQRCTGYTRTNATCYVTENEALQSWTFVLTVLGMSAGLTLWKTTNKNSSVFLFWFNITATQQNG